MDETSEATCQNKCVFLSYPVTTESSLRNQEIGQLTVDTTHCCAQIRLSALQLRQQLPIRQLEAALEARSFAMLGRGGVVQPQCKCALVLETEAMTSPSLSKHSAGLDPQSRMQILIVVRGGEKESHVSAHNRPLPCLKRFMYVNYSQAGTYGQICQLILNILESTC